MQCSSILSPLGGWVGVLPGHRTHSQSLTVTHSLTEPHSHSLTHCRCRRRSPSSFAVVLRSLSSFVVRRRSSFVVVRRSSVRSFVRLLSLVFGVVRRRSA